MSEEKIITRIEKLLALAGNNSNQNEAQTALLKAQKLMLEYKIDESRLGKEKKLNIISVPCGVRINTPWGRGLMRIISENFRCMWYLSVAGRTHYPIFFGDEEDVLIARSVFRKVYYWLDANSINYAARMRRKTGSAAGIKADYILGFLYGLTEKFKEQLKSNEQYALMVITPKEVTESYTKLSSDFQQKKLASTMKSRGSAEAMQAGYHAGKNFETRELKKVQE